MQLLAIPTVNVDRRKDHEGCAVGGVVHFLSEQCVSRELCQIVGSTLRE